MSSFAQQLLALLAQDGILRLLSLNHCKVVFQLGSDEQVTQNVKNFTITTLFI